MNHKVILENSGSTVVYNTTIYLKAVSEYQTETDPLNES